MTQSHDVSDVHDMIRDTKPGCQCSWPLTAPGREIFMRYLGRDGTVFMWYLGRDETILYNVFGPLLGNKVKNTKCKNVAPDIDLFWAIVRYQSETHKM